MSLRLASNRLTHVLPVASQGSSSSGLAGGAGTGESSVVPITSSLMYRKPDFQPTVPGYCRELARPHAVDARDPSAFRRRDRFVERFSATRQGCGDDVRRDFARLVFLISSNIDVQRDPVAPVGVGNRRVLEGVAHQLDGRGRGQVRVRGFGLATAVARRNIGLHVADLDEHVLVVIPRTHGVEVRQGLAVRVRWGCCRLPGVEEAVAIRVLDRRLIDDRRPRQAIERAEALVIDRRRHLRRKANEFHAIYDKSGIVPAWPRTGTGRDSWPPRSR